MSILTLILIPTLNPPPFSHWSYNRADATTTLPEITSQEKIILRATSSAGIFCLGVTGVFHERPLSERPAEEVANPQRNMQYYTPIYI